MKDSDNIVLEKFAPDKTYKNQKKFDCGLTVINKFVVGSLKKQVRQNLSQCFVLLDICNDEKFIGFYTLSSFAVDAPDLERLSLGSLPGRIPCCRLIMLGVDKNYKGRGLGRKLMKSAILKTIEAANQIGIFGLYLDADPGAYSFYVDLGFTPLKQKEDLRPTPMFMHIETMRSSIY